MAFFLLFFCVLGVRCGFLLSAIRCDKSAKDVKRCSQSGQKFLIAGIEIWN